MNLSKALIEKYNTPVPRYTSYPPANYFTETYTVADYQKAIEISNAENPQNISFYVHIPFCKKICYYCGCNSCRMRSTNEVWEYMDALKKEIAQVLPLLDKTRKVAQIHYGGGTPNAIPVECLQEINALLLEPFETIEKPEIAIECNPAYLDEEYIEGLADAGFNRLSLGIQDFDTDVLDVINRDASAIPVKKLVELVREKIPGVSVNLDFIYGLPLQTVESFTNTIEKAIAVRPDRLVTFAYAHVPWIFKAQKALEKAGLPSSQTKNKMFLNALDLLEENGYTTIGMDHYALDTDELSIALKQQNLHRNFQGYCTRRTTGQVYAFGASSISQLGSAYAQNVKGVGEYIETITKNGWAIAKGMQLTKEQMAVREVINELMCNRTVHWPTIADRMQMNVAELKALTGYDATVFEGFTQDNILTFNDEEIIVDEENLLFMRNVAAALDPLMKNTDRQFSKPM